MNIPLNIDWQQILLHLFNFGILTGGLYLLLYKPVKEFMDKREAYFADKEAAANKKIEEADALKAQYADKVQSLSKELEERRAQENSRLGQFAEKEKAEARAQAERIVSDARLQAEREKNRIIEEAQKEIADLAARETEKLVMKSVSDAYDQFLSIAEGSVEDE